MSQTPTTAPAVGSVWIYPRSSKVITITGVKTGTRAGWSVWHSGRPDISMNQKEWEAAGLLPYRSAESE